MLVSHYNHGWHKPVFPLRLSCLIPFALTTTVKWYWWKGENLDRETDFLNPHPTPYAHRYAHTRARTFKNYIAKSTWFFSLPVDKGENGFEVNQLYTTICWSACMLGKKDMYMQRRKLKSDGTCIQWATNQSDQYIQNSNKTVKVWVHFALSSLSLYSISYKASLSLPMSMAIMNHTGICETKIS